MDHLEQFPAGSFRFLRYAGVCRHPTVRKRVRIWCALSMHIIFFGLQLAFIMQNIDLDLTTTCEEILVLDVCLTVVLKFIPFCCDRENLYALVEEFKTLQKRAGANEFHRIVRCNEMHAKLVRILYLGTSIVGLLYTLNAAAASVSDSLDSGELRFVISMKFPYDYQHPVLFALSFLFILDTMILAIVTTVTFDSCFSEMAQNLAIHFDILSERFAALDFTGSAASAIPGCDLLELIAYHGAVLELAADMERRFRRALFFLLLTTMILCVLGFEFVVVASFAKRLQVVMMAVMFTFQAVIYTYNGSIITAKSSNVAEAIYASNWYEASPAIKKLVAFCLMRAQKPVVMRNGIIYATLPTLKMILSSSYSYTTMLLSLESDV